MRYSANTTQNQSGSGAILWIARILVGMLFIFSGLVKANDPMGFGYKLQEYFNVFNLGVLNDFAVWMAIVLCALEIILGALLILGIAGRKVAWGLLVLIVFFTFLTFYSAVFEVVQSCGCFGDAIPLTTWQSFVKDLILLVLILYIFRHRRKITPFIHSLFTRNLLVVFVIIASFSVGIYTFYFLPIIDFLPYKEGNDLPELMNVPEGAEPDVYEHIYEIQDKTTGETRKVSDKEYLDDKLWEDDNLEVIGEPSTKLIKKGYTIPIPDLIITDIDGVDRTQEIIENPYYNFIVVSTDLSQLSSTDLNALDRINSTVRDLSVDYNIRAILATASSSDQVDHINDQMDLVLETFYVDAVPLKSMVRANPGVMLMLNGTVVKKWSPHNFPSKHTLINSYLDNIE